ncbi:hypothetical protein [Priestia koreensis]|uniref:hypothetical protein n=1 Tax=Priestia koreensis TaxID=284581 RepID=UPI001F58420F|nr:hypothetical protein [Priestia koreensis]UNL87433.1 hypothetical protein IE339_24245 [Priestia koreensis]
MEPIVMPVEDYYSYHQSASNLAMLKAFFDAGIDISKFSEFMEMIGWNTELGFEIFNEGLNAMFGEVILYEAYGDNPKVDEEDLQVFDSVPDYVYLIEDQTIKALYRDNRGPEVEEWFNRYHDFDGHYTFAEFRCLPHKGFTIGLYGIGFFHEIAKCTIDLTKQLDKIYHQEVSN